MDEKLKGLKGKTIKKQLQFSDKLKENIYKAIEKEKENDEFIQLTILQLLLTKRTGFELTQRLITRGVKRFLHDEGELYVYLHQLEHQEYIASEWDEDEKKYYIIRSKGKRYLQKLEGFIEKYHSLHERIKGEYLYE